MESAHETNFQVQIFGSSSTHENNHLKNQMVGHQVPGQVLLFWSVDCSWGLDAYWGESQEVTGKKPLMSLGNILLVFLSHVNDNIWILQQQVRGSSRDVFFSMACVKDAHVKFRNCRCFALLTDWGFGDDVPQEGNAKSRMTMCNELLDFPLRLIDPSLPAEAYGDKAVSLHPSCLAGSVWLVRCPVGWCSQRPLHLWIPSVRSAE